MHSFWHGESEEIFNGLRFNYHTEDVLLKIVESSCDVLEIKRYAEMETGDSFYVVLKAK